jgi:hypothetical protein
VISSEHLQELQMVCAGATEMTEGGQEYIYLPALKLPEGCNVKEVEALLCLSPHTGYATRLFLAQPPGRGANPTSPCILGRTWHTWSWKDVPNTLRPMEILAEHLRGLR